MAMTQEHITRAPRTLQAIHAAAQRANLNPRWASNNTQIIFDCPQCKYDGDPHLASATFNKLANLPIPTCDGCNDDHDILYTLAQLAPPWNNVTELHPERNGQPNPTTRTLNTQTWRNFETTAGEDVPCLITNLWPEGALGFIGAAPKAGKTWLGLDIAISVTTGTPVFGSFPVPTPKPVLYVALEGHRAAIRTRIGCISRGHQADPDSPDLDQLHLAYKPRGINLTDPGWASALCDEAIDLNVRLVIVDVLRRAAQIKENDASSFMELVSMLNPISDQNISVGMLHHFNKINELTSTRTPAERMAGSGAMFGAFDVGLFITKSENHARKLTIHTDIRDLAAPDAFIITLNGNGTGAYGGFTYKDTLRITREDIPTPQIKGAPLAIRSFIIEAGGTAPPKHIRDHFGITEATLRERRNDLETIGVYYINQGPKSRYELSTPSNPHHPATGPIAGSPEHPAPDPYYVEGSGCGVKAAPTSKTGHGVDRGVDEVRLDDEDDTAYWAMLNAINDPEAKEHE